MKSFQFRLQRVLSWRGTELTLAEAKLEQLTVGLRTTDAAIKELAERGDSAQTVLARSAVLSGAHLRGLEASRVWAVREEKRLAAHKLDLEQSIEDQNHRVAGVRRGVKLVERLKERQHTAWKTESDRQITGLAEESAIAQWRRLNR